MVTGVVSILHPQFGSEWGCRCYTSCWCSYGFPLHLFFYVWVFWHSVFGQGSVFNWLFSALCRGWLSALAIFVGMCMYTSLFVCYIFIFVCSCLYIVYILVFFFSFVCSLIPVFLGILGFGSAILRLISGVWLIPVVLLSFARFSTLGAGGLEGWCLGWAGFRCGSCDGGRAFYIQAVLRVFHLPSFLEFYFGLFSLAY